MLQYCCFTSILCLRHQEGQVGPDPQVVEIIFVYCLTTIRKTKRVFLTWYLSNITETYFSKFSKYAAWEASFTCMFCFLSGGPRRTWLFVCLFVCLFVFFFINDAYICRWIRRNLKGTYCSLEYYHMTQCIGKTKYTS